LFSARACWRASTSAVGALRNTGWQPEELRNWALAHAGFDRDCRADRVGPSVTVGAGRCGRSGTGSGMDIFPLQKQSISASLVLHLMSPFLIVVGYILEPHLTAPDRPAADGADNSEN
jgi:hypothetical protein